MRKLNLIAYFKLDYFTSSESIAMVNRPNGGRCLGVIHTMEGFVPSTAVMLTVDEMNEIATFMQDWEGEDCAPVAIPGGHDHKEFHAELPTVSNQITAEIPLGKPELCVIGSEENWPAGARMSFGNRRDPWDIDPEPWLRETKAVVAPDTWHEKQVKEYPKTTSEFVRYGTFGKY